MTNKIINGDAACELSKLSPNSAQLIVADPPYGNVLNEKWDRCSSEQYKDFSHEWLTQCHRVLKDNGSLYVWGSLGTRSVKHWLAMTSILSDIFILKDMVVWAKQRGRGNIRGWLITREEILWATKNEKNYIWNKESQYSKIKYDESWIKRLGKENNPYKRATNVWTDIDEVTIEQAKLSGGRGKREQLHPSQKPIAAIERLILTHTNENDLVIDLFAGSGTTSIACKKTGRYYIAIEKDENYCEIIQQRLDEV